MSNFLKVVRRRCREVESAGEKCNEPFDQLRNALWQIWPLTFEKEKLLRLFSYLRIDGCRERPVTIESSVIVSNPISLLPSSNFAALRLF